MNRSREAVAILALTAAVCTADRPVTVAAGASGPGETVLAYVAAVRSGRWDEARRCWDEAELARAERLGITYRDVPLKVDCASPLLWLAGATAGDSARVRAAPAALEGRDAAVDVTFAGAGDSASCTYRLRQGPRGWRLVSAATAVAAGWPTRETAFLLLHEEPPLRIGDAAVARLDSGVADVCRALGVSARRMALLRRQKIEYYFGNEAAVERMAGAPTRGVALLPIDAVVTTEPCHLHEVVHLLASFAVQNPGLYAPPALQEGLAVHLGGRWGRAPDALREMGAYALAHDLIALDDLLTWDGATSQSADLTYAPAGVVTAFLLDRAGAERFLDLYRLCSGSLAEVRATKAATVRDRLASAVSLPAAGLDAAILSYATENAAGDLEPGPAPGTRSACDTIAVLRDGGLVARVVGEGEWIGIELSADGESGDDASGALLLSAAADARDRRGNPSRLFGEVLPQLPDRGEIAALVVDPHEAGWYDFRCDLLLAKHVEEFRPTHDYATADGRLVRLHLRRRLLPAPPRDLTWRLAAR